ncbi:hypothetical protein CCHR01_01758 [Colletotrichum chrysophilum]|uniref:Uncharacterized protein n=1 Tax=Colletotrichum chrysophilum TaxID=1836956 RepID=A0AAD9AX00_9PEZI|nr:hypothetical protein CCHR01_01758 [Colletotrichum chrysophilum]
MGNKNSTPQRRNTDNTEQQLQYHTPHGPVSAADVSKHLETVPPPHTRTRSNYPHPYRGREGRGVNETKTFDDYVTGPGRSQGPTGVMHEYPIPTSGDQFIFQYDRPCQRARQAQRQIHPNERANVMGPINGRPANTPGQTRAAVRVAQVNGEEQSTVVGVMVHPEGNLQRLERAPLEPLSREGRQEMTRHADERGRTRTYPPRGVDAGFVGVIETRFAKERPPAHPQMRLG